MAPSGWAPNAQLPRQLPSQKLAASLAVATAAALLAVGVGASLAAALSLTDLPGRSFWATLLLLPFLAPGVVWTLGQTYCYGAGGLLEQWIGDGARPWLAWLDRGGYAGATLVLAEIHAPLAMLIVSRGMHGLQQSGFESARLHFSAAGLARWTVGAVRQELAAALLLTFALILGNFTVPHVLQCRLYPIEVYLRLTNYLDSDGAICAATALALPSLAATMLFAVAQRRRRYASAAAAPALPKIELGAQVVARGGACGVRRPDGRAAGGGDDPAMPLRRRFRRRTAKRLAGNGKHAAYGIGGGCAGSAGRHDRQRCLARRPRFWMEALAILPLGVPALVLGMAYSQFYNRTWPVDLAVLGDSSALLALGLAARGWPFATRLLTAGRRRIAPEWEEAAQLARLGRFARWRWLRGPLLSDQAAAATVLTFVLATGEVEISQMLCAGRRHVGVAAVHFPAFWSDPRRGESGIAAIGPGDAASVCVLAVYESSSTCRLKLQARCGDRRRSGVREIPVLRMARDTLTPFAAPMPPSGIFTDSATIGRIGGRGVMLHERRSSMRGRRQAVRRVCGA